MSNLEVNSSCSITGLFAIAPDLSNFHPHNQPTNGISSLILSLEELRLVLTECLSCHLHNIINNETDLPLATKSNSSNFYF